MTPAKGLAAKEALARLRQHEHAGTAAGFVAIAAWSASVSLIRLVSERLGPIGGAASYFLVAGILTALLVGVQRPSTMSRRYLWCGGACFVGYEICFALALGLAQTRQQALELAMVNYLWPCLTLLMATLLGQQRHSWLLWPGIGLSFGGVVWVVGGDSQTSLATMLGHVRGHALADGLALAAAFLWAGYSAVTRAYGHGKSGVPLFLLTASALLWGFHALTEGATLTLDPSGALAALVLGGLTALGYACWNFGIQRGRLSVVVGGSYLTPLLSVLLSCLALSLQPPAAFWHGLTLVLAGLAACWWGGRPPTAD